ncbi:CE1759 family FMN reductase [Brachybacterium saurashtrense]|uniref:Flavoprotein n=1 Tax=Brachybacterium saurashtrense TaxID=556288 RepID=A0A345YQS9_9MICO|nr:CE1759 family FMN reductase [Brachybacterium saurashtrense]AXK46281.1 flavoprotein [Brachybacterium saurashtrense]RRR24021.1 flavoprotein [Brachybacterium saurashtrense]
MTTPTTPTFRILALSAGLSTPSSTRMLADQLTREAAAALRAGGAEVEVTTIELREHAHDLTDALLTRFPSERLAMVSEQLRAADAVIAVTPIFNVGPSGLFKLFVDALDIELWRGKPVLLGATAGSARHSLAIDYALRPLLGYLKAELVPTAVFAASTDFGADTDGQADELPLAARVRRAARELAVMLRAGSTAQGPTVHGAAERDAAEHAAAGGDAAGSATAGHTASAGTAEGRAAAPASARTLDAEFSDFVPMGQLLGRD